MPALPVLCLPPMDKHDNQTASPLTVALMLDFDCPDRGVHGCPSTFVRNLDRSGALVEDGTVFKLPKIAARSIRKRSTPQVRAHLSFLNGMIKWRHEPEMRGGRREGGDKRGVRTAAVRDCGQFGRRVGG